VALCLVFLPSVAMWVFDGPLPADEWPFALLWGAIFALPFGYLALATRAWIPWAITGLLTACVWGALIAAVLISVREQPGVNFYLVPFMLAAPIVITVAAAAAVHHTKKRP
jgi:hypothetical protein